MGISLHMEYQCRMLLLMIVSSKGSAVVVVSAVVINERRCLLPWPWQLCARAEFEAMHE